jgi:guanosine-3',5'-bis(diphosphate) 3'-pyrophosphohydrolase
MVLEDRHEIYSLHRGLGRSWDHCDRAGDFPNEACQAGRQKSGYIAFAADKHRGQRRKDAEASPYINHPIAVATLLAVDGRVSDEVILLAAALHDTVEETQTTFEELDEHFRPEVTALVRELTDDKSLGKKERKRLQIEHAPQSSSRAKQLKIADKICNIRDITVSPPADWSLERRGEYLRWSERVVDGCRHVNAKLDQAFDQAITQARKVLKLTTHH